MMRKLTFLLVALTFCGAMAKGAEAGNRAGAFSFTPMIGGYVFDGDQDLDNAATFGLGLGYNLTENWTTEAVLNFVGTELENSADDLDLLSYRLDALYHFSPAEKLVPYLAAGIGGMNFNYDPGPAANNLALNWGGGLKYFIKENLALRADIRHIIGFDDEQVDSDDTYNNLAYTVGITQMLGAAPAPMAPVDSDGDGVIDSQDDCPDTPKGVKVDTKGCPLDTDGDGVYDYLDKCPGTPEGVEVDSKGCPLDADGDGVYDYLDKCPDTPEGVKVDMKGCPLDTDGDGVYDYLDKCPGTPKELAVDEEGCPISFALEIEFDTNKADVRSRYHDNLAEAAAFIKKYPAENILVAGYTDSVGSAAYNKQLSQQRAENVRQYLVNNFDINATKLVAKGYGEENPIADNGTAAGRQKNRRVEVALTAKR